MPALQRIQAGVEQYCVERNGSILSTALIINSNRVAGSFNITQHLALFDQGSGNGCGCKYCLILYKYTQANILLHRFKKNFESDDYTGPIKTLEEFNKQYFKRQGWCKEIRGELEELSEQMRIPNAVKRKQYEKNTI